MKTFKEFISEVTLNNTPSTQEEIHHMETTKDKNELDKGVKHHRWEIQAAVVRNPNASDEHIEALRQRSKVTDQAEIEHGFRKNPSWRIEAIKNKEKQEKYRNSPQYELDIKSENKKAKESLELRKKRS